MIEDDEQEWEAELDEFDHADPELLPCPSCGAEVYEETQRCPHCGEWITPLAASARTKSRLWIVAAVAALIGIIAWAVR